MTDPEPDPLDTAIAELTRRKQQRHAAAESDPADRHAAAAETYGTVIGVLREIRDAHAAAAAAADPPTTGVTIDADELVIVEATERGHRRRTYRAAPDTPGVDARLKVARWHADGWRVVGEEPIAQLVVNGERVFE